jgi:hypothetical protein
MEFFRHKKRTWPLGIRARNYDDQKYAAAVLIATLQLPHPSLQAELFSGPLSVSL